MDIYDVRRGVIQVEGIPARAMKQVVRWYEACGWRIIGDGWDTRADRGILLLSGGTTKNPRDLRNIKSLSEG